MERVTGVSSSTAIFPPRIMYSLSAVAEAIVFPTPETAATITGRRSLTRGDVLSYSVSYTAYTKARQTCEAAAGGFSIGARPPLYLTPNLVELTMR
jgi:heme O synthase-like polyprenyltransferase